MGLQRGRCIYFETWEFNKYCFGTWAKSYICIPDRFVVFFTRYAPGHLGGNTSKKHDLYFWLIFWESSVYLVNNLRYMQGENLTNVDVWTNQNEGWLSPILTIPSPNEASRRDPLIWRGVWGGRIEPRGVEVGLKVGVQGSRTLNRHFHRLVVSDLVVFLTKLILSARSTSTEPLT